MKIDILVSSLRGGGAERVAANLANGWHDEGAEVRVITGAPLDQVEYRPLPGVELVSVDASHSGLVARLIRLRSMLKSRRADVVIAVQANMAIEAAIASAGLGLVVIGCEHNTPERSVRGRLWNMLRPFAYRRLAAVTTLTSGAAVDLKKLCPGVHVVVVPNVLRLPLEDNPPRRDPADFLPSGTPLLLAAGRMVEAKGFDRLVAHFAKLSERNPNTLLAILGDGPLRSAITEQVETLGLTGRVLLPGRAGNMADWYRRASVYVMTSRWEGLPMVMIEAMAHGVPVVATDFRHGPRDVIRHGVDGLILPDDDVEAWSTALEGLLRDDQTRSAMAREAAEVKQRYSERAVLAQWERLFGELITGRAAAKSSDCRNSTSR